MALLIYDDVSEPEPNNKTNILTLFIFEENCSGK